MAIHGAGLEVLTVCSGKSRPSAKEGGRGGGGGEGRGELESLIINVFTSDRVGVVIRSVFSENQTTKSW